MNIKFIFNKNLIGLNSPFAELLFLAVATDAKRYSNPENNNEFIIESTNDNSFSLNDVTEVLNAGFKVEGLPVFIKLSEAQYQTEVLEGLANREDKNGEVKNWNEWKNESCEHLECIDGSIIVQGNSATGVELNSTELSIVLNSNLTVLKGSEIAEFLATGEGFY